MLGVYSEDRKLTDRVRRCLGGSRSPEVVTRWDAFRELLREADAGLVAAPDPSPDLFGRLQSVKELHPLTPLLLLARRDAGTLRRLKDVRIEEVVWSGELERELGPSLERAEAERRFREIEERLSSASGLSPTLRAALVRAVRRRPPLLSVADLAAEVDRDRRTLWHHWSGAFPDDSDLTPKGFLDWILLLRAVVARSGGQSWQGVADDLGVHTRTLRRMADRRLDLSLPEVQEEDRERLFRRFRAEVLEPLAPEEDGGAPDGARRDISGLRTA
jgi:hypothetical protein